MPGEEAIIPRNFGYWYSTILFFLQIKNVKDYFLDKKIEGCMVVMDEADAHYSSMSGDTKREYEFNVFRDAEATIHKLIKITATPLDIVAWHIHHNIPASTFMLENELLERSGYTGVDDTEPFKDVAGNPVFYTTADLKKGSSDGWYSVSNMELLI